MYAKITDGRRRGDDRQLRVPAGAGPQLYREARNAERDALFDARTTCFYARRAVELNASRAVIGVIEQLNASADAG